MPIKATTGPLVLSLNSFHISTTSPAADIILFKGLNLSGRRRGLYIFIIGLLFGTIHAGPADSTGIVDSDSTVQQVSGGKVWNPVVAGALSAAIPGAGQLYTGHYFKAGTFLAYEVITGVVANFWYRTSQIRYEEADFYKKLLVIDTSWEDSMMDLEYAALMRYDARNAKYKMYNALSMVVGGYIFNILSGVGNSRYFVSDAEKSPAKAAWLSAIPGLGLGQMYNGSIAKAGFIMMTQVSMGVLAVNEHRQVNEAQRRYRAALGIKDSLGATPVAETYNDDWEGRRSTAFRNRNQWLWYSLAFYFYGILDAVVDAHLHDYNGKIRAYPDLVPERSALRINVDYRF